MIRLQHHPGPGSAPPLVMIPGIDGSDGSVRPIALALTRTRPVIVVDYQEERQPTLSQLVTEIAERLDAELRSPFDVLGQSIGSVLAARLDAETALPIRRVVLCCTFTRLRWTTLRVSNALARITPNAIFSATSPLLMRLVCGPVGDGAGHPFFVAVRRADRQAVIKRTGWEIGTDFTSNLAGIDVPALVLMGARDRFVPNARREAETLRALYRERNDVRVEVIPDAGHVLLPSAAIATAVAAVEAFLGREAA